MLYMDVYNDYEVGILKKGNVLYIITYNFKNDYSFKKYFINLFLR